MYQVFDQMLQSNEIFLDAENEKETWYCMYEKHHRK